MATIFHTLIARSLQIPAGQVERTVGLLNEGATIPFISRYRKEVTGGLDEIQIGAIKNQWDKLTELEKRKASILATIEEQGKLSPELRKRIEDSWDSTEIEDLYLPYKPKRVTRAEIARKKGLEPLAKILMLQNETNLPARVKSFVKGVSLIQPPYIFIVIFFSYHIPDKGFSISFRKEKSKYRSYGNPHIIIYKPPCRSEDQHASQAADGSRKNRDHNLNTLN